MAENYLLYPAHVEKFTLQCLDFSKIETLAMEPGWEFQSRDLHCVMRKERGKCAQ